MYHRRPPWPSDPRPRLFNFDYSGRDSVTRSEPRIPIKEAWPVEPIASDRMPSCKKTVTSWGRSPAKKRMTRNRSGTPERLTSEPPRWTGESGSIVRRQVRIEKRDGQVTGSPSNPEALTVRCAQFSSVFEHRGIILTRRRTTDGITTSITRGRSGRIPSPRCSWSPIQNNPRVMTSY